MKRKILIVLVLLLEVVAMIGIYHLSGYYTKDCIAYDAHTFEDRHGNLWEVTDTLEVGEKYTVKMHEGTLPTTIIDDVVVSFTKVE